VIQHGIYGKMIVDHRRTRYERENDGRPESERYVSGVLTQKPVGVLLLVVATVGEQRRRQTTLAAARPVDAIVSTFFRRRRRRRLRWWQRRRRRWRRYQRQVNQVRFQVQQAAPRQRPVVLLPGFPQLLCARALR